MTDEKQIVAGWSRNSKCISAVLDSHPSQVTINFMVNNASERLDKVFSALSDPYRVRQSHPPHHIALSSLPIIITDEPTQHGPLTNLPLWLT